MNTCGAKSLRGDRIAGQAAKRIGRGSRRPGVPQDIDTHMNGLESMENQLETVLGRSMESKLKPCPHCGSEISTIGIGGIVYFSCNRCGAETNFKKSVSPIMPALDQLVAWNTRALDGKVCVSRECAERREARARGYGLTVSAIQDANELRAALEVGNE